MHPALGALYALQQIDSALQAAQRKYNALDTGNAEQAALSAAETSYAHAHQDLHETSANLHDAELELKSLEQKRRDHEKKLYSGKVTAFKELEALQQEVEALGRQRSRLDERILEYMDRIETVRAAEAAAKSNLDAARAAFEAKQTAYKAAAAHLVRKARQLTAEREKLVSTIPPALLKRYDSLRAHYGGVGIGNVKDGLCGACHTQIATRQIEELQTTDHLITCQSCGRLLCMVEE